MTDDQIKHMVDRFLMWRLPQDFSPDNGIIFDPVASRGTDHEYMRTPVGTNLLDVQQATAMVRHMIDGMPNEPQAVSAWQPMETAPKDGTRIDVWFQLNPDHGARWANVRWSPEHEVWSNGPPSQYKGGWIATHWMCPPSPLSRPEPQSSGVWQPIGTADKDRNVLVAHDGEVSEAYYNGEDDHWYRAGKSPHDFDFVNGDLIFPTHWMPLPEAPSSALSRPDRQSTDR